MPVADDDSDQRSGVSRRALLAGGVAGIIGAGCSSIDAKPTATRSTLPRVRAATKPLTRTGASSGADWLIAENAKPGAVNWRVPTAPQLWERIRGFASVTSIPKGGTATLYVSTIDPVWTVDAYRIGWYQGHGARLVWSSENQQGEKQDPPVTSPLTNMRRAPWQPSMQVTAAADWPPGQYLLKLGSSGGGQSYIPLVVRDDESRAALLVQSSVTTWQAYNEWGGASLYCDERGRAAGRSKVVTFDRPYWRTGAGEFFGREYEFIQFVERNGFDVTYCTNIDTHDTPGLLQKHAAFVSLAHDEYYSTNQRQAAESARDAGVNLVFMGSNACFRKIRLEPSAIGPYRQQVNYRIAHEDPMFATDPDQVTVNWRQGPRPDPESSLVGNYYESNPVDASMVIVNEDAWLFDGSGLRNGDELPHLVGNEYDRVTVTAPTPNDIEVMCHSPVVCRGQNSYADTTWYTAPSGAGVFATGTFWWVPQLAPDTTGQAPSAANIPAALQRVTHNILTAAAAGPAGRTHPATRNVEQLGIQNERGIGLPSDTKSEAGSAIA